MVIPPVTTKRGDLDASAAGALAAAQYCTVMLLTESRQMARKSFARPSVTDFVPLHGQYILRYILHAGTHQASTSRRVTLEPDFYESTGSEKPRCGDHRGCQGHRLRGRHARPAI